MDQWSWIGSITEDAFVGGDNNLFSYDMSELEEEKGGHNMILFIFCGKFCI